MNRTSSAVRNKVEIPRPRSCRETLIPLDPGLDLLKIEYSRRLKMGKTVVIDADECIGCESCVELCAEVFAFNEEEEKAEVIMPEGGPEDCIEEAMDTCPVECIHWEED